MLPVRHVVDDRDVAIGKGCHTWPSPLTRLRHLPTEDTAPMERDALLERYFETVISGRREDARNVVDSLIEAECDTRRILTHLIWPTLQQVQTLHRNDQMSNLAHGFATRLMRHQADQLQLRLDQKPRRDVRVLFVSGPEEPEELGSQIAADLLEADGYEIFFCGGGVANDEIVEQLGQIEAQVLVSFGAVPSTVPFTRLLIDRMHEIGLAPRVQIVVGGGVFNRADGLAEEIGADLWAHDPDELVEVMNEFPGQRMYPEQRTVGRKRRQKSAAA